MAEQVGKGRREEEHRITCNSCRSSTPFQGIVRNRRWCKRCEVAVDDNEEVCGLYEQQEEG